MENNSLSLFFSLHTDMKEEFMVVQEYLFVRTDNSVYSMLLQTKPAFVSCGCFQPSLIQMQALERNLKPHQKLMGIFP